VTTTYAYDFAGAVTNIDYSDATPDVSLAYDRLGRQKEIVTAGIATNSFVYNTYLELTNETVRLPASAFGPAATHVVSRGWDSRGRPSSMGLDSDYAATYAYPGWGRIGFVTGVVAGVTNAISYDYYQYYPILMGWTNSAGFRFARTYEAKRDLIASAYTRGGPWGHRTCGEEFLA
jgi:hypothetical protein